MNKANKWDWLYKVGVEKVIAMKLAGRDQEDVILEREGHEYTFSPNRPIKAPENTSPDSVQKLRLLRSKTKEYSASAGRMATNGANASKPVAQSKFVQ